MLIISICMGLCLINFQKVYAFYQLKVFARQLINDIRYIQLQSMVNPDGLPYKIKFWTTYLNHGNRYQIYRGDLELIREVRLPENIEMYFGGKGQPFAPDGSDVNVRVLKYKIGGESGVIGTNTGTINLRERVNGKAVGVVVHAIRVRLGDPNEVDD